MRATRTLMNRNGSYAETFLILKDGTEISEFNKKISGFLMSKEPTNKGALFVTQYSSKYLYGNYENGVQSGGRIRYVRLFFIIALFTLGQVFDLAGNDFGLLFATFAITRNCSSCRKGHEIIEHGAGRSLELPVLLRFSLSAGMTNMH